MQKILNILFILILVAIATTMPLNTAFFDIHIFRPIVENTDEPTSSALIEEISFAGLQDRRVAGEPGAEAGAEHSALWIDADPNSHLIAAIAADDDSAARTLTFLYHSDTGAFTSAFPQIKILVGSRTFEIKPEPDRLFVSGHIASLEYDTETILRGLPDGYHMAELMLGGQKLGRLQLAKNTRITRRLLGYSAEVPDGQKVLRLFLPDASYRTLIPVSRLVPSGFGDYITLYHTLMQGGPENLGFRPAPAIAVASDYWIAGEESRIDFRTHNLEKFPDPDLVFESLGYTFASLGNLKTTNVRVDGKPLKSIPTPQPPYFYLPYENETNHLYIVFEPHPADSLSRFISDFTEEMKARGILPPAVKLINCQIEELPAEGGADAAQGANGAQGEIGTQGTSGGAGSQSGETGAQQANKAVRKILRIEYSDYELVENRELFEVLLNLSAYSFEEGISSGEGGRISSGSGVSSRGATMLLINGTESPRIQRYNEILPENGSE